MVTQPGVLAGSRGWIVMDATGIVSLSLPPLDSWDVRYMFTDYGPS